ncbi:MAG: Na+/H+ antiporter NhaC family protein [Verrucomicrobiota bacterium]|nr:Na+/H+ antiporter NhaC family protein [Verrucomicrobiota bacterium]
MQIAQQNCWLRTGFISALLLTISIWLADSESASRVIWPSLVALLVVILSRSALVGLLVGASCGAILLADGSLADSLKQLIDGQFYPIFSSSWKISAILFTLILGGFVALLEAGGGLQGLVQHLLGSERSPRKRMQMTVMGFGLIVFFDGLANTMLIGRMLRSAADRCGVSREKLAYLADTTGSAVACLAFISTWIAFQLSMIREGFSIAGQNDVNAYMYFFKSLPTNYYCWFALALALICVLREYNPGPMGEVEAKAQILPIKYDRKEDIGNHWSLALIPIATLTLLIPILTYFIGTDSFLPINLNKIAEAYGRAEIYVPYILIASSTVATMLAALTCSITGSVEYRKKPVYSIFFRGVQQIAKPVCILIAAWMLGAAISQLGTASWLSESLQGRFTLALLPAGVFLLGAFISFSTGSSWGTMSVLMPLAIPVIFSLCEGIDAERDTMIVAVIGAVFSGAVFGDHCSPFSDTTIVASIATEIEPLNHVRTQLPFALIAAAVTLIIGFLPLGYGIPAWFGLFIGFGLLFLLPRLMKNTKSTLD